MCDRYIGVASEGLKRAGSILLLLRRARTTELDQLIDAVRNCDVALANEFDQLNAIGACSQVPSARIRHVDKVGLRRILNLRYARCKCKMQLAKCKMQE